MPTSFDCCTYETVLQGNSFVPVYCYLASILKENKGWEKLDHHEEKPDKESIKISAVIFSQTKYIKK